MKLLRTFLLLLPCATISVLPLPLSAEVGVTAVLPNGRTIRPLGNWASLAPYPFALAIRSDGQQIAIPSVGFPFALNVVDNPAGDKPSVTRMPAGKENDPAIEVHAGLAYSPDGSLLYVATGDSGKIRAYRTSDWKAAGEVSLDEPVSTVQKKSAHSRLGSFAATLTISADGKTLYALDQGRWRIVIIDAEKMQRVATISTGRYPYELALSPDGQRLYVTNTGLFAYTLVAGVNEKDLIKTGLHFPPSGYPSARTRNGAVVEGKKVAGLGDENSLFGSSVWTYDVHDRQHPVLTARLRLGRHIGEGSRDAIGGAAPTGVAATQDAAFVTLAHQDTVVKISADGSRILGEAKLSPFTGKRFEDGAGRPLRGVQPIGVTVRDNKVYATESGIDAVAVIDAQSMQVLTHIPVGWNPSAIALSPDGSKLYVVNSKGKGTGPNAGAGHDPKDPTYIGSLELGSLSIISLDKLPSADSLTETVIATNTAAISRNAELPRLKHCFLIIRENRTYDEVLGDVAGSNGDPSLARYGMDGWVESSKTATHLKVTPNLHALASQYAISDNFYVDSEVSADGHRWIVGIRPTPFFQTAVTSGYGGRRHSSLDAEEPGRRAMFGGADAPVPEDEPQFGSLWEHVTRNGKGVLNYGEGLEIEGNDEMDGAEPEGQRLFLNTPVPKPIYDFSDRRYPTFNLGIPDQFRATEFERDFSKRLAAGKIPGLIVIRLPNDHTTSPRPADGYPYSASYVADNDLALGRILQYLSSTPIWKDSAVFVTEDDAQSGVDHVDAHRSILLIASPWVRPGVISHTHTDMGSISRTIDELLGIGFLNLEDALAGDIGGIFLSQPRAESFKAVDADPRLFIPSKARIAKPKTEKEAAALRDMDNAEAIRKDLEKSKNHLRRQKDRD